MGRLNLRVRWALHEDAQAEIDHGADVNEVVDNLTPLDVAIGNGDVAMVDLLIRAGADVNHGHPLTGKRPLHDAVLQPDLRILELLLLAGANVEGCRETSTPLCVAATFDMQEAFNRLIAAGANPQATMHGKLPHELRETGVKARKSGIPKELITKNVDKYASAIRKMIAEYPNVEEYAAHHGRSVIFYSLDLELYSDHDVEAWAREFGEIVRSSERLKECQERFLTGPKLDEARRSREAHVRRHAREELRKDRIAKAAESFTTAISDWPKTK